MNTVRKTRLQRKMTQRDLAGKVGTSQQQIQRIENGQTPTLELACRISSALKAELTELFPIETRALNRK